MRTERKKYVPSARIPVVSYEQAKADGMSSSTLRTISRSLERISKDCFSRIHDENFEPRFGDGLDETKASLTEAGKAASENAYAIRILAARLKKEGL